jgi:putative FmdB family regulatory protein
MPIYEYKCQDCGAEFEELIFNAEKKPHCPVCSSATINKKVSLFGCCGQES